MNVEKGRWTGPRTRRTWLRATRKAGKRIVVLDRGGGVCGGGAGGRYSRLGCGLWTEGLALMRCVRIGEKLGGRRKIKNIRYMG